MACWVIAVRGTYKPVIDKEVGRIIKVLTRGFWERCLYVRRVSTHYIVVCDKENKCYGTEMHVKSVERRPAIVILTPEQFLLEIAKWGL